MGTQSTALLRWAQYLSHAFEDAAAAILGLVPQGLSDLYDQCLQRLPIIGSLFAIPGVAKGLKLVTGITLCKVVAHDLAHYIFKPLGYLMGLVVGLFFSASVAQLIYQGSLGRVITAGAAPAVGGALVGGAIVAPLYTHLPEIFPIFAPMAVLWSVMVATALLAVMLKIAYWLAMKEAVQHHHAQRAHHAETARVLGKRLKGQAKRIIKDKITEVAQTMIQQVNGQQPQDKLADFFQSSYEKIAARIHQKIERHFNYIIDRASHGDERAYARLTQLAKRQAGQDKDYLAVMLDRLLNDRTRLKLKDDVDTIYDHWQYRHLRDNVA